MQIVLQHLLRDTTEAINLFSPTIDYDVDSLKKELLEKYKDCSRRVDSRVYIKLSCLVYAQKTSLIRIKGI